LTLAHSEHYPVDYRVLHLGLAAAGRIARSVTTALTVLPLIATPLLAGELAKLKSYNAGIAESSISGISSGAFMAVQFATAWSSVIKGVGVVAGGPFWCATADAEDVVSGYAGPLFNAMGSCMQGPPADLTRFIAKADAKANAGEIDPTRHMRRQKVYIFHGYNDTVVAKSVTDSTADFYRHYLGDAGNGNLYYQTALGAGHSLVVLQQARTAGLNNCNDNEDPYIDQCGYDQAGIMLQYFYGALRPPNRDRLSGKIIAFDQSIYSQPDGTGSLSLSDTGYVFVPAACAAGERCRVHIVLHGCKQDVDEIGRRFIDDTGYNAWADTNQIIVLYPQTKSSWYLPLNPQACWDWWGYISHDDHYVTQAGEQIRTIKAMLDALTAAVKPIPTPGPGQGGAPEQLTVVDTSDTGAALAWTPVDEAIAYHVWRAAAGGTFELVGQVIGPSFGDSGLVPRSSYQWRVAAVVQGVDGPSSAVATATTLASPQP
jgi:poly(3-hydroxybutyrate) depolymerase